MAQSNNNYDSNEFEIPETHYIRDIENRVFHGIILQSLAKIEGITLLEGNFIDYLLGRESAEGIKGIYVEQDSKNHSVTIKVEVNVCYGISIPDKAEEIQTKLTEEIIKLSGLHVAAIHVVFKNLVSPEALKKSLSEANPEEKSKILYETNVEEEYSDEF